MPINPSNVGMYCCGPTVYWSTHIGHMSKYIGDDVLKRILIYLGYKVKHVMNVTDVGHLVSDADEGEDKMERGAEREGLSVWDIAAKYEAEFFETMDALNVSRPNVVCRATEHIKDQIALIKRIEKNGFTYQTDSAVYFDISKFPNYGQLSGQKLTDKMVGARDDVVIDSQKKHPYDFALWFKCVGRFANHVMHWDSPWGDGFPGWHIECSAMSMKYLGESFDIHTGGIDHVGVHHPAEIAQSEAATGKKFVKYWIHRVFIMVNGKKMGKSLNNFYTLEDIRKKGCNSLALRYLFLTGHYRQAMNFTWRSLGGAQRSLERLRRCTAELRDNTSKDEGNGRNKVSSFQSEFKRAISDDLNTPQALALVWEMLGSGLDNKQKYRLLLDWDKVFGFGLEKAGDRLSEETIPQEIKDLAKEREKLRQSQKYKEADKVRERIEKMGYKLQDTKKGIKVLKNN